MELYKTPNAFTFTIVTIWLVAVWNNFTFSPLELKITYQEITFLAKGYFRDNTFGTEWIILDSLHLFVSCLFKGDIVEQPKNLLHI